MDASGAAGPGSGPIVQDVTRKLREKVKTWREEKRAEQLFQEMLNAFEDWFGGGSISGSREASGGAVSSAALEVGGRSLRFFFFGGFFSATGFACTRGLLPSEAVKAL